MIDDVLGEEAEDQKRHRSVSPSEQEFFDCIENASQFQKFEFVMKREPQSPDEKAKIVLGNKRESSPTSECFNEFKAFSERDNKSVFSCNNSTRLDNSGLKLRDSTIGIKNHNSMY